jgi:bifunctional NMN adenylyltransferase/nudix hydrolase
MNIDIKKEVDSSLYPLGVIIGRFQVHKLHDGHKAIIDRVCGNHKKVIIFLGVSIISNTKENPLDFATRRVMIQEMYPNVIVLPLKDQRSNERWSNVLDNEIKVPFGDLPALLYGSRESFIPCYSGKNKVTELTTDVFYSGTEIRKGVSREILTSEDFRAGIIHANYAQRAVTYPTVDVVAYNDKGQILLGKKPNENNYRFIGGFVDRTDMNWEQAAKREFSEETGGCEIGSLEYVSSGAIHDWRYAKTESGIMTTLFVGKFLYGAIRPSDDIASLHWLEPSEIDIDTDIMPEHQHLFADLRNFLDKKNESSGNR